MAGTKKTNMFKCPNCEKDHWPKISKAMHLSLEVEDGEFIDETITCECKTVFRIYEDNDFGDWTQELISHIDPNQMNLQSPEAPTL